MGFVGGMGTIWATGSIRPVDYVPPPPPIPSTKLLWNDLETLADRGFLQQSDLNPIWAYLNSGLSVHWKRLTHPAPRNLKLLDGPKGSTPPSYEPPGFRVSPFQSQQRISNLPRGFKISKRAQTKEVGGRTSRFTLQ